MPETRVEGTSGQADPVEVEWQFDALDLRPVERWLATLPTLAVETDGGGTVTALAQTAEVSVGADGFTAPPSE